MAIARRAAYLLIHAGHEDVLVEDLPSLQAKRADTPLDRSNGYGMSRREMTRDPQTGVLLNVPPKLLHGWFGAVGVG